MSTSATRMYVSFDFTCVVRWFSVHKSGHVYGSLFISFLFFSFHFFAGFFFIPCVQGVVSVHMGRVSFDCICLVLCAQICLVLCAEICVAYLLRDTICVHLTVHDTR